MVKNKWKACLAAGVAALTAMAATVSAAPSEVTVQGGPLTVSSHTDEASLAEGTSGTVQSQGFSFGSVTVDVSAAILPSTTAVEYVRVDDNTGKNKGGWSVNVSATPLQATVLDATTTAADDTVTVTIPIGSVLQVAGSNLTRLHGPNVNVQDFIVGSGPLSGNSLVLLQTARGKGQGAYKLAATYTLSLPSYLPAGSTVSPQSRDSAFRDATVTDLSLFAGTYYTTITYATSEGP